jgi:hypothetical protein
MKPLLAFLCGWLLSLTAAAQPMPPIETPQGGCPPLATSGDASFGARLRIEELRKQLVAARNELAELKQSKK